MGIWDTSNDQEFQEGEQVALMKKSSRSHTRRASPMLSLGVGAMHEMAGGTGHMGQKRGQRDKFGSCRQTEQNRLRSEEGQPERWEENKQSVEEGLPWPHTQQAEGGQALVRAAAPVPAGSQGRREEKPQR